MGIISYSGSYIGSHKTNDGRDIIYTYPPDFKMVFPNYRKQSSWDRDAILGKALTKYVNRVQYAPKVHHGESERVEKLENIDTSNVPISITGGELAPETKEIVGLDKVNVVKNVPIVLVAIAIGVLGYFLFGRQRG